jgi:hypothetical protein
MTIIDDISFRVGLNMITKDNAIKAANVPLFTNEFSSNVRENPPKSAMMQRVIATATAIRIETFWRACRISSEVCPLSGVEEVKSDVTELAVEKIDGVILRRKN